MRIMMQDYEKLGSFYLGRLFAPEQGKTVDDLLLYDARDLTTHAVCVGMTGSGKTGLCVSLLEEAAIDGIPSIVIDPKGDMGNLLLTFPDLSPSDFEPWIEPQDAVRKGMTPAQLAKQTAKNWRDGLAAWHQPVERITRLKSSAEWTIYTPGNLGGRPLSLLRSFEAPSAETIEDTPLFREYVLSAVSGLLALAGITGDPIRSREHILLSSILDHHWRRGQDLDISALIHEIQKPPFNKVGVFDLDSFYPLNDRMALAMAVNNLLASPGFSAWSQGEPLDIQRLLYTKEGKPRVSILSIAHLADSERMFFVTILLNAVMAWMRKQSGTSSLRAILYMDEIFGFFPPTANPPSKPPMLTLLKQARAYGLGVVLATQNPVDLDYKGLANTGTWLIGRLQTDRDKARVLDGLEGAAQGLGEGFTRSEIDSLLSGLGKRVFLMHNVHQGNPVLFQSRWALSFLRGPLTMSQIKLLTGPVAPPPLSDGKPSVFKETANSNRVGTIDSAHAEADATSPSLPASRSALPPGVEEFFLRPRHPSPSSIYYRPLIFAQVRLHFVDARSKTDCWQTVQFMHPAVEYGKEFDWHQADKSMTDLAAFDRQPLAGAQFAEVPNASVRPAHIRTWTKNLVAHIYQEITLELKTCSRLKLISKPEESEGDFRARIAVVLREKRDEEIEKMRKKFAARLTSLQEQVRKAEIRVNKSKDQYGQEKISTAISFGATLLGALLGRKAVSVGTLGRAATTMRGGTRAAAKKRNIEEASESLAVLMRRYEALEAELETGLQRIQEEYDSNQAHIATIHIRPRKADISVTTIGLAWMPGSAGRPRTVSPPN
jgi:hypothetical protein